MVHACGVLGATRICKERQTDRQEKTGEESKQKKFGERDEEEEEDEEEVREWREREGLVGG